MVCNTIEVLGISCQVGKKHRTGCICTAAAPCSVALDSDAVPKESWLLKLRGTPALLNYTQNHETKVQQTNPGDTDRAWSGLLVTLSC